MRKNKKNKKNKIFKELKLGFKTAYLDEKNEIKKANGLISEGKLIESENIFKKLIENGTDNPIVFGNLAAIYGLKGEKSRMINLLKKAIKIEPNYADAYSNLGVAFLDLDQINEAVVALNKAIEIKPDYAEAYLNLGLAFSQKSNLEEAIILYKKAISIKNNYPDAYINLGMALLKNREIEESIISFEKAISLEPKNPDAHSALGKALLLIGNYERGLFEYEFRFKKRNFPTLPHASPNLPLWKGEKINEGEELLVVAEQGLGDTIQFMRYLLVLRNMKINVSFCAQEKLHELIKVSMIHSNPISPKEANLKSSGKWISLLSLPRYLKVNPKNPILEKPYLLSIDNLIEKWGKVFAREEKPIIGINWQGNKDIEKSDILKGRSMPLEVFSRVVNNKCKFISLQKGYGSEQLNKCSFIENFAKFQDEIDDVWDFVEYTAILKNCSLVLTTDTSIAHLSGGLGKETWLFLQDIPDWRWGYEGNKTFWYPNMKIFRQTERDNWDELLTRVSKELIKFLEVNHEKN